MDIFFSDPDDVPQPPAKVIIRELEPILSKREIEVVMKRLDNKHITQTESNYLSRSVRPKLK